jgi:hypothetical protein
VRRQSLFDNAIFYFAAGILSFGEMPMQRRGYSLLAPFVTGFGSRE